MPYHKLSKEIFGKIMLRKWRGNKIVIKFIVVLLMVLFITLPVYAFERPELRSTTTITSGALLKEYHWETSRGPVNINVIEIDLNNPNVRVEVIPGAGSITRRLNVSAMARNTGAIAAINADFFNTRAEGAPIGPMVMDTRLVSSPSQIDGLFALGITQDRRAYIEAFNFQGRVASSTGAYFRLSGLNQTQYWQEAPWQWNEEEQEWQPSDHIHSHVNTLHLYNDLWGGSTRGHDTWTIPTEMLVRDGRVVEIVEGRFFDGPVPQGAYILRSHGYAANFLVQNFQPGDEIDIQYSISPDKDWSMIVGGHALLVNNGVTVPYTRDLEALGGVRARSAAGISADGRTLYLVGVERNLPYSAGLSLINLSLFFQEIGAWKALNLDGGGSTTMVARPAGELGPTVRVLEPEQPQERLVVNAIAVFSIAADIQHLRRNITSMRLSNIGYDNFTTGSQVQLQLDLNTSAGATRQVPFYEVQWQFYGLEGHVSPQGLLTIGDTMGSNIGFVVARYHGFSAPMIIQFRETDFAQQPVLQLTVGEPVLTIDGVRSGIDVAPVTIDGRTMVPVRAVFEALGATVDWDQANGNATIIKGNRWIDLWSGEASMVVNGNRVSIDVAPQLIHGRTMLPLRAISENLGLEVDWEPEARRVTIE